MKYILFLFAGVILLFAGCKEGYEVSKTSIVKGYDFTKYTSKGFLFTPEPYNGEYDAIGMIEISLYPAVTEDENKIYNSSDTWDRGTSFSNWFVGKITASEVLDSLYNYTKKMGANAVVRLQIEDALPRTNGEIVVQGIKASGFAIKRK